MTSLERIHPKTKREYFWIPEIGNRRFRDLCDEELVWFHQRLLNQKAVVDFFVQPERLVQETPAIRKRRLDLLDEGLALLSVVEDEMNRRAERTLSS